jgi:hypothetical protein
MIIDDMTETGLSNAFNFASDMKCERVSSKNKIKIKIKKRSRSELKKCFNKDEWHAHLDQERENLPYELRLKK